jgi:hypothetical protein
MFDTVKVLMAESQDPNARLRFLYVVHTRDDFDLAHLFCSQSLGASSDAFCLSQILHEMIEDGNVQDLLIFITECARNGQATLVSQFYMDHYAKVRASYVSFLVWL